MNFQGRSSLVCSPHWHEGNCGQATIKYLPSLYLRTVLKHNWADLRRVLGSVVCVEAE